MEDQNLPDPVRKKWVKRVIIAIAIICIPLLAFLYVEHERHVSHRMYIEHLELMRNEGVPTNFDELKPYFPVIDDQAQQRLMRLLEDVEDWEYLYSEVVYEEICDDLCSYRVKFPKYITEDQRDWSAKQKYQKIFEELRDIINTQKVGIDHLSYLTQYRPAAGKIDHTILFPEYTPNLLSLRIATQLYVLQLYLGEFDIDDIIHWRQSQINGYSLIDSMQSYACLSIIDDALLYLSWRDGVKIPRLEIKEVADMIVDSTQIELAIYGSYYAEELANGTLFDPNYTEWYESLYSGLMNYMWGYLASVDNNEYYFSIRNSVTGKTTDTIQDIANRKTLTELGSSLRINLSMCYESMAKSQSEQRMVQIGMDLCRHYRTHKTLPNDIQEIENSMPQTFLLFNGKRLEYSLIYRKINKSTFTIVIDETKLPIDYDNSFFKDLPKNYNEYNLIFTRDALMMDCEHRPVVEEPVKKKRSRKKKRVK